MKTKISGKCPVCTAETLHLAVNQGDSMRVVDVNKRITVRVIVKADVYCANREVGDDGWCEYRVHMEPREIGFKEMKTER